MDLKEIINRPSETILEEEEAMFLIKKYVFARKKVEIEPTFGFLPFGLGVLGKIQLLHDMIDCAIYWFKENEDKIKD